VTVLNLWATWCVPCRAEMPSLERLYRAMGPRGLRVIAVSVDDGSADDKIRDFVGQYGLTFTVLHEGSGEIEQRLQTSGVPETFVIGRDGVIRKRVLGATAWDSQSNQALITALLDEPAH
jgi:thiol-disulfide isomerase/thioredoxin